MVLIKVIPTREHAMFLVLGEKAVDTVWYLTVVIKYSDLNVVKTVRIVI